MKDYIRNLLKMETADNRPGLGVCYFSYPSEQNWTLLKDKTCSFNQLYLTDTDTNTDFKNIKTIQL